MKSKITLIGEVTPQSGKTVRVNLEDGNIFYLNPGSFEAERYVPETEHGDVWLTEENGRAWICGMSGMFYRMSLTLELEDFFDQYPDAIRIHRQP